MPTLYKLACLKCNQDFDVLPRDKKKKFCSDKCCRDYSRNDKKLDNCLICHKLLNRKIQKKFCSLSCSAIFSNSKRTEESRDRQSVTLRKTLDKNGLSRSDEKEIYYSKCLFGIWSKEIWQKLPGYDLVTEIGMYHPVQNPEGAVRDHIISKDYGWKNSIDYKIISHPANCRIITNRENIKKGVRSDLNLEILLENIKNWCE